MVDKALEKYTENQFKRFCTKHKLKCLKLVLVVGRGFPDRTVIGPNRLIVFIEFKRPSKTGAVPRLRPHQKKWKRILEYYGFPFYTCNNVEDAKNIILKHLNES